MPVVTRSQARQANAERAAPDPVEDQRETSEESPPVPQDTDTNKNPLSFGKVATNPFLDEVVVPPGMQLLEPLETRLWRLFRNSGFADPNATRTQFNMGRHVSGTAMIICARYNQIPEDKITQYYTPGNLQGTAYSRQVRRSLKKRASNYQRLVYERLAKGIHAVVKLYTNEEWARASKDHRHELWGHLWDKKPYDMAKMLVGPGLAAVDVQAVYSPNAPNTHTVWRGFFRDIFIGAADLLFTLCPTESASHARKLEFYKEWRALPQQNHIRNTYPPVDDMPVVGGGIFSCTRVQKPQLCMIHHWIDSSAEDDSSDEDGSSDEDD